MREAVLAHAGDARATANALTDYEQATIIEFLKTLQVLPSGTNAPVVDERGEERDWPPRRER